jgi:hypothetical protein
MLAAIYGITFFELRHQSTVDHRQARQTSIGIDQHLPALNLHRIHRHLRPRRPGLARLRIPLPSMPWTNNLPSRNYPLPQRPAAMQANIIHGVDLAIHVGEANDLTEAGKLFRFINAGKFSLGGKSREHPMDSSSPSGACAPRPPPLILMWMLIFEPEKL